MLGVSLFQMPLMSRFSLFKLCTGHADPSVELKRCVVRHDLCRLLVRFPLFVCMQKLLLETLSKLDASCSPAAHEWKLLSVDFHTALFQNLIISFVSALEVFDIEPFWCLVIPCDFGCVHSHFE